MAILVLINLYSCSTDLSPRPLLSLGKYNTAVELRGCLRPFSLFNFLVSLSMLCKSPNGQCWVQIGYVKTRKANWFVALTRFASDRGLVQIIESLCKYVSSATVSPNLSSSITDSLTPRILYLVPVLRFSSRPEWYRPV